MYAWGHHVYRKCLYKHHWCKKKFTDCILLLALWAYLYMQRDLRCRKLLPSYPNKIDGNDTRFTYSCVPCFVSFIRIELYRKAVCLLLLEWDALNSGLASLPLRLFPLLSFSNISLTVDIFEIHLILTLDNCK